MDVVMNNVSVKYGDRVILDDISHTFEPGKINIILGPNGCGKTTFVKLIAEKYSREGNISYVAQNLSGNIGLTVYDFVALGRYNPSKYFGGLNSDDKAKINTAISDMGLTDFKDRLVDTLSGGEKQRAMVARALCQDVEWMILDEPSASLDVKHTESIMRQIKRLCTENGKSFIIVIHDINIASKYGDEFILMKDGKIFKAAQKLDSESLCALYDNPFEEIKAVSKISGEGYSFFYSE